MNQDNFEKLKQPFNTLTGKKWNDNLNDYLSFINFKMLEAGASIIATKLSNIDSELRQLNERLLHQNKP